MATALNFSPLVCGVCLENKEQKTPKALPCLHSFCQECLEEWHTKHQSKGLEDKKWIECPLCRQRANIPVGGVSAFPLEFNVQQFADYLQAKGNPLYCQKGSSKGFTHIATTLCKTCHRLFCEMCTEEHSKIPLFFGHEMTHTFCRGHGASLDYVCVTCSVGVCVDCVHSDVHKEHEITKVEAGLRIIKTTLKHMNSELINRITGYNKEIDSRLQSCLKKQCESENTIKRIGELIKGKVDQIVEAAVRRHHKDYEEALKINFASYGVNREWEDAVVSEIDHPFQGKAEDILQKLQKSSNSIHESLNSLKQAHMILPDPDILSKDCCCLDGVDTVMEALDKCTLVSRPSSALSKTQSSPVLEFVRKVECSQENGLDSPWTGHTTQNGDIVVCNWRGGAWHKVRRDGSVHRLYNFDDITASLVYDDCVYAIRRNGKQLLMFPQGCLPQARKIDIPVPLSHGIAADGKIVFISNHEHIVLYSLSDHTCKCILKQTWPNSITCMQVQDFKTLVVADKKCHQIVFYNETGNEIRRFGKRGTGNGELNHPCGVKRLVNGNIYVADWANCRIVEFEPDGTFIRNVLTNHDGLDYPCDVALNFPYLWVIECVNSFGSVRRSIKLFKFV